MGVLARSGSGVGSMPLLAWVGVTIVLAGCHRGQPPPIEVSLDQIQGVRIQPVPEGPPAPPFVLEPGPDERPLEEIDRFIPRPLPAPLSQSCTFGGDLIVTLESGREISYGPCRRPVEIDRLWWHILDVISDGACRPNCWPGGKPPPGETAAPADS
jgi:hypothetical protein